MAHLKELAGKSWHEWPQTQLVEIMEALSPSPPTSSSTSCSASVTPNSSRSHSPKPDDVMKLPRREMGIFGQCPVQDEFILVVCDICHKSVKIEAFASHVKLRHQKGIASSSSGRYGSTAYKSAAFVASAGSQQPPMSSSSSILSHDTLLKDDLFSLSTKPIVVKPPPPDSPQPPRPSSALSASSTTRPSSRSSVGTNPPTVIEATAPPAEPMEIDSASNASSSIVIKNEALDPDSEDVDEAMLVGASSSNVISIPDTDVLPPGMSNDLMAMVGEAPLLEPHIPTSTSSQQSQQSASTASPPASASSNPKVPVIKLQVNPSGAASATPQVGTTDSGGGGRTALTTLLLSGSSTPQATTPPPGAKKTSPAKLGRGERKPLREYHPDKHCGVRDPDSKRHCTRALTCKSHSVLLKRRVEGRSQTFDDLVAAHKRAQAEAAAAAAHQQPQQIHPASAAPAVVTTTSIQLNNGGNATSRSYTPTVSVRAPPSMAQVVPKVSPVLSVQPPSGMATALAASPTATIVNTRLNPMQQQFEAALSPQQAEDNLHYTTDHPRPLAICGLRGGGRRVGGLIVTGRNHVLTRKLVRVSITAGTAASMGGAGFHRIRPRVFIGQSGGQQQQPLQQQQQDQYLTYNYSLSGNLKRGNPTPVGGVNLTTLPPGGVVIPESFKTDIQDFKGGIKFELGRKIKHILPSGSEVTQ